MYISIKFHLYSSKFLVQDIVISLHIYMVIYTCIVKSKVKPFFIFIYIYDFCLIDIFMQ